MPGQSFDNKNRQGRHRHPGHSKSIALPTRSNLDLVRQTPPQRRAINHVDGIATSQQLQSSDFPGLRSPQQPTAAYPRTPKPSHQDQAPRYYNTDNVVQIKRRGKGRTRSSAVNGFAFDATDSSATPVTHRSNQKSGDKTGHRKVTHPATAYAGPSFHASPAASALPIPKFFSKSVPENISALPISDSSEQESSDSSESSPTPLNVTAIPAQKSSEPTPLDFLFQAAREAMAKEGSQQPSSPSPVSEESSRNKLSPPTAKIRRSPEATSPLESPSGIFTLEMEGSPSSSTNNIGPSFATPYHERLRAVRPNNNRSSHSFSLIDTAKQAKAQNNSFRRLASPQSDRKVNVLLPSPSLSSNNFTKQRNQSTQSIPSTAQRSTGSPARALTPASYAFLQHHLAAVANGTPEPRLLPSILRYESPRSPANGESPASVPRSYPNFQNISKVHSQLSSNVPCGISAGMNPATDKGCSPEALSSSRSLNLKSMEEDLRRVLKLGST